LAGRRISLQHTVATFFLIELSLFLFCGIAPNFYLEKFDFILFTPEQFEAQLAATAVGTVLYICAARLYPVYAALVLQLGIDRHRIDPFCAAVCPVVHQGAFAARRMHLPRAQPRSGSIGTHG
jgi:hypothetical protein